MARSCFAGEAFVIIPGRVLVSPVPSRLPVAPSKPQPESEGEPIWLLRRTDQLVVAACTLALTLGVAGYWVTHGGLSGRLVEIDRAPEETAVFWVDINDATWPEFAQLPDIGEALARRIVESREARGRFADHEDLTRVPGIGPKTLARMRPYLKPMPLSDNVAGR